MSTVISTEVIEKLHKKYGARNVRKAAQFYHSGLPERYWFNEVCEKTKGYADDCVKLLNDGTNVAVVSNSIKESSAIITEVAKRKILDKKSVRNTDFITFNANSIDKFGQLDLSVFNSYNGIEFIFISGIKRYGKMYDRFYPAFSSLIESMISNSVLNKQIILGLELRTDNVEEISELFGEELMDVVTDNFEIYSTVEAGVE